MQRLRNPEQELQAVLANLDHDSNHAGQERRGAVRQRYRADDGLEIRIEHPGGSVASCRVRPRSISATGIAFLHTSFIHADTPCTIHLRLVDGEQVAVSGRVVRCRCVRGTMHDVGMRFDRPIPVAEFVSRPLTGGTGRSG